MSITEQINFLLSYNEHLPGYIHVAILNNIINDNDIKKLDVFRTRINLSTRLLMCSEMLDNKAISGRLTQTMKNDVCQCLFDFKQFYSLQ